METWQVPPFFPESNWPTSPTSPVIVIHHDNRLQLRFLPSPRRPTCCSTQRILWVTDQTTRLQPTAAGQWGCRAGTSLHQQPLISHYCNAHGQSCDGHIVQLSELSVQSERYCCCCCCCYMASLKGKTCSGNRLPRRMQRI